MGWLVRLRSRVRGSLNFTSAACAPALTNAVEERSERPLSEDPEFWRAAPEAALQWSAEEFGFPDQRRGDHPNGCGWI